MPYLPSLRKGSSLLDLFKIYRETSSPLIVFHEVLLRGPSPFSEVERELIAAYVSGLNFCRYCYGVHTATAERLGVPEGAVSRLITSSPEMTAIGHFYQLSGATGEQAKPYTQDCGAVPTG